MKKKVLKIVLLHFCQHIAHDLPRVVFGHVQQLGPRKYVIHVVLELVVLGEAEQVAVLHLQQVIDRCLANANHRGGQHQLRSSSVKKKEEKKEEEEIC